jgi:hypothetical protein
MMCPPPSPINAISYETGLLYGKRRLATSSGKSIVRKIRKGEIAKIFRHSPTTQPKTTTASRDVASQLERLAR